VASDLAKTDGLAAAFSSRSGLALNASRNVEVTAMDAITKTTAAMTPQPSAVAPNARERKLRGGAMKSSNEATSLTKSVVLIVL